MQTAVAHAPEDRDQFRVVEAPFAHFIDPEMDERQAVFVWNRRRIGDMGCQQNRTYYDEGNGVCSGTGGFKAPGDPEELWQDGLVSAIESTDEDPFDLINNYLYGE